MEDFYAHISKEFRIYFEQYTQIDFALLFGSFLSSHFSKLSDIDSYKNTIRFAVDWENNF